jgi:hypothetical protein
MKIFLKFTLLASMVLGLPLLGVFLSGSPVKPYLTFPPKSGNVHHPTFSWIAFIFYSVLIAGILTPFVVRALKESGRKRNERQTRTFPWWGWAGLIVGFLFWLLAWTRFPWYKPFQLHTFTPLWLSYIVVMNGLSYRRSGRCLMLDRPMFFIVLFPVSAAFWWFFEYLNRFVENWSYVQVPMNGWSYFWRATVPFSTVLAAVLSAKEWIGGMAWVSDGFREWVRIEFPRPSAWACVTLGAAGLGLLGIGVWPNYLFSLLWVSPLVILLSIQVLFSEENIFSGIPRGDWRVVVSSCAAALFCGWFWEMWNYWSLAKWTYHIPFVHRFQIFEMPILGYAGYLPFGLECALIGDLLGRALNRKRSINRTLRKDGDPR